MSTAVQLSPATLLARRNFSFQKNFMQATTDDAFTLAAASGTLAVLDERGAGLSITTQALDNALGTAASTSKFAVIAADKPLYASFMVQHQEAATDKINVFVGLISDTASSALANNGAGIPASVSGIGVYKLDAGSANWTAFVSNATVQTKVELNATNSLNKVAQVAATGSGVYQLIEIEVLPKTLTKADVVISINGTAVQKFTDWVYTSIAAMQMLVMVKAGSATAEAVKVKTVTFDQVR